VSQFDYAYGIASHVEGAGNTGYGDYSHTEGIYSQASGPAAHASGIATFANFYGSYSEGVATISDNVGSHSQGIQTGAFGVASHAQGRYSQALGSYSHAQGYQTSAIGSSSFTAGEGTTGFGPNSHAGGFQTMAAGFASQSSGLNTSADGQGAFSGGILSFTDTPGEFARAAGGFSTGIGLTGATGIGTSQFAIYHTGLQSSTTTPDQPLQILYDGSNVVIPERTVWGITATLTGTNLSATDPTNLSYFTISCVAYRGTGPAVIDSQSVINAVGSAPAGSNPGFAVVASFGIAVVITPTINDTRWTATISVTSAAL
jgi:hypothetical protein